jgi:FlgN protein
MVHSGYNSGRSEELAEWIATGESSRWLPMVMKLLDEQLTLCRGLDALSQRQSQAVARSDTDGLLRVLGERGVIIDRVGTINRLLEPFREAKASAMQHVAQPERDSISRSIAAIADLVERVQTRDDADKRMIEQQRSAAASELTELSRARGAVRAYGGSAAHTSPRYQDREG